MKTKNLNGYYNIVGSNIKKYRELKNMSQRQLTNKLNLLGVNIYNSDICRIENHTLFIRDYEQKAICKVLGISYEQLYENTDSFFN